MTTLQLRSLITATAFLLCLFTNAQNNVGIGTAPNASAKLDVSSTTQGMLVPRMTTVQRNAIATPATGLMVYDITLNGFQFYNGTVWTAVGGGGGIVLALSAEKNVSQTLPVGSNTPTPDIVVFENVTTSPVSAAIGSWNASTNTYTVGASGAGLYLVDLQLTAAAGPSTAVHAIPTLDLGGGVGAATSFYGHGSNYQNALNPTAASGGRSSLQRTMLLAAGATLKLRANSSSTAAGTVLSGDATCYLRIIKLN